jgi:hypothetical protein
VELFDGLVDAEAGRLVPRRKLLERFQNIVAIAVTRPVVQLCSP